MIRFSISNLGDTYHVSTHTHTLGRPLKISSPSLLVLFSTRFLPRNRKLLVLNSTPKVFALDMPEELGGKEMRIADLVDLVFH